MVVPVIVSNPKIETCDLISGMIVMRIEGNIINLSCLEILRSVTTGHSASRFGCYFGGWGLYVLIQVVFAFLLIQVKLSKIYFTWRKPSWAKSLNIKLCRSSDPPVQYSGEKYALWHQMYIGWIFTVSFQQYTCVEGRGINEEFGICRYKLLCIKQINKKVLPYSTGNYIQCPLINHNGKEYAEKYVCI